MMWIVDFNRVRRLDQAVRRLRHEPDRRLRRVGGDGALHLLDLQGELRTAKRIPLQEGIYRTLFASWLSPINASLAFAIAFVLFWYGVLYLLHRRGIILKV